MGVKVLDFGLAKALDSTPANATVSNSPTLLSGTMAGVIIGTAAYMSPEQAPGAASRSAQRRISRSGNGSRKSTDHWIDRPKWWRQRSGLNGGQFCLSRISPNGKRIVFGTDDGKEAN